MIIDRYRSVLVIGIFIFLFQFIGAYLSDSAALMADTFHVLHDLAQILIALLVERIATGIGESNAVAARRRAGYIQCTGLAAVSLVLLYEGFGRMVNPVDVSSGLMFVFAFVGLVGNWIQHSKLHGVDTINAHGLRLHILSDLLQSIGVVLGAIAMLVWRCYWVDGLLSFAIGSIMMVWSAQFLFRLLRHKSTSGDHAGCGHDHTHHH